MVKVDDATYIAMRDNLYNGDSAAASKAKAQIESSYTDEQYNKFVSQLGGVKQQPTAPSNTPASTPANTQTTTPPQTTPEVKQETEVKQAETVGSTVPEIQQQGALKPLSQDYYNQTSDDAQSKIISNLNNYRQTNPEYFRDYESFKKNFSYDARNDEQKQTLDSWYGGYQKGMELAGIPVTDLYTQYKDGQVSMNELENLRIYDPTKYAELQNQINKGNIIAAYDDDKGVDTTGMSIQDMAYNMAAQTFTKLMSGDNTNGATQYFRDLEAKMESPEMLAISDQCTDLQEQIENLNDDRARIKKEVEKEYEGTGATRSKINAIIADRSYELDLQLRTLNSEYNKYATQYNNRMQQYQNEFSMQLQEYQLNQQARNQQMQELGFAMDLMNFETNEQKAQREWDYWVKQQEYTNGNINSSDYQTRYKAALKSVQNLLSQYEGIPMQRSAEQMAQDILTAIDQGSDLGAELTKINQQIQGKKEYKMLYNQTFKNPDAGITGSYTIGDQQYVVYNGKLMSASEFNSKYGNVNADGNATTLGGIEYTPVNSYTLQGELMDFANNHSVGSTGGWCGKFVNDYLQSIGLGRLYGDSVSSKTKTINTDKNDLSNLAIGSVAVFDYSNSKGVGENARNYGHVAIVSDIDLANNRVKLLESNYNGDKKVTNSRWVNVDKSGALKGFFDPSKGSVSISDTTTTNTLTTTKLPGGLTESGVTQLAKDMLNGEKTYSEIKAAYGDDGLNVIENKMLELQSNGFERSTKITDPSKLSNVEKSWRDYYDKKASDAQETLDWVSKMEEAYNLIDTNKNAASQAITIAYNKILDPGSVVREGEYARSAEGQSYLSQIQAKLEKMKDGGAGLTKQELKSMIDVAKKFSENAERTQMNAAKQTMVAIEKYGLTPEAVLPVSVINKLNNQSSTTNTNTTQSITTTSSSRGGTSSWYSTLPLTNTWVKITTTNVGGYNVPTNFYQQ